MTGPDARPGERSCGTCSLCCTVLRVDELAKLGGRSCMHQLHGGGCGVYPRRPAICRAYRCAWLGGAFGEDDRPDRLGAVLDFVPRGDALRLVIRQADPTAWDSSRLREIAADVARSMPVEVRDVADVLDPQRPYRVLRPDGTEQRVVGELVEDLRDGVVVSRRRAPFAARVASRIALRIAGWRLGRWPSHEERAGSLARPIARDRVTCPRARRREQP